jgi:hypothetical protein
MAYVTAKESDKAVRLFNSFLDVTRRQYGSSDPRVANQLEYFSRQLLKNDQDTAAEPMLRECLTIRSKTEPEAWTTFNTQAMLGANLLGQKKFQEAEPLLKDAYEGMSRREKLMPFPSRGRLTEVLERLVQLTEETGRKDEAEKWDALLVQRDGRWLDDIHDGAKKLTLKNQLDDRASALIFQIRLKVYDLRDRHGQPRRESP